jgi:hypothetical protein
MTRLPRQFGEQVPKVQELFKQLGDSLFSCSHELARAGGANWDRAEALFKLAKSADQLRHNVISVLSDEEVLTAQHYPSYPVETLNIALKERSIRSKKSGKSQKRDYPKYRVSGDLLIKTGLSRDARKEYEHTLTKKDFDALISLLAEFSSFKTDFAIEEIRERLNLPSYQIYTVLSLLRARDLLLVPKRGLYSFRTPRAFPAEAANLWEEIRKDQ